MLEIQQRIKNQQVSKGINLVGLDLSESEFNKLLCGNTVSLESKSLSEIGSLLILAEAVSASIFGNSKKSITFEDLPKMFSESKTSCGIPIYSWNNQSCSSKCYLYLTLDSSKPTLYVSCDFV